jgi:hypothetical protein
VVLYECKISVVTLREEHRLRVFENRMLGRMFGPERGEVTEGWRKLHYEELHKTYPLEIQLGDEMGCLLGTNGGENECI